MSEQGQSSLSFSHRRSIPFLSATGSTLVPCRTVEPFAIIRTRLASPFRNTLHALYTYTQQIKHGKTVCHSVELPVWGKRKISLQADVPHGDRRLTTFWIGSRRPEQVSGKFPRDIVFVANACSPLLDTLRGVPRLVGFLCD